MTKKNKKILVVDDDNDIRDLVCTYLEEAGYDICFAVDGTQALALASSEAPDLIVLDVELPDMLGFYVCQLLREKREFDHVPILMLTARVQEQDELKGFSVGVNDYITKPFKLARLLARVHSALEQTVKNYEANPLTGLPGNAAILREISARIAKNQPFSVIYADLNNFKAFNDAYGFLKGDDAIRLVATVMEGELKIRSGHPGFLGHVGGDDFVAIVDTHEVEPVLNRILDSFDEKILGLYTAEDRARKGLVSKDRSGQTKEFPIMGLAIAVITNKLKAFAHPGELSLIAGDLKKWVKSKDASAYMIDRRS